MICDLLLGGSGIGPLLHPKKALDHRSGNPLFKNLPVLHSHLIIALPFSFSAF